MRRRALAIVAGAALAAVLLAGAAARGHGRVARNVTLAGRAVGGLRRRELETRVHALASRYAAATIDVRAPGGGVKLGAGEIDLSVDEAATARRALAIGRRGAFIGRAWSWLRSFVRARRAPVVVRFDPVSVYALVVDRDEGPKSAAVEPSLSVRGGKLVAVPGHPGHGLQPASVTSQLRAAARRGLPIVVRARRGPVSPRFTTSDAERLAPQAEALIAKPLTVSAAGHAIDVPPSTLRSWLRAVPGDTNLGVGVDEATMSADLTKLLGDSATTPSDAGFVVSGGAVHITPSHPGMACCAPEAASTVAAALGNRPPAGQPVVLPLRVIQPHRTTDAAKALGIVEQVATFTTHHNPGEPRVHNIHLIADLLRGAVIEPGQSLSVNGKVGPRTLDKGFVVAPVIGEGNRFDTDVGGGISQFATTLFNAAFFAGMEIPEYSAHGLYITRYPYGREATLSYPHPDLIIRNPSPYGVLVWTSYTDSDITVSLWSTKWVDADQTDQTKTDRPAVAPPDRDPSKPPLAPCEAVKTQRTRTFVSDGHTSIDYFYALYRPEEGASCAS